LAKFARQNVKVLDHDQKVSVFEGGVFLADVLKSVGVPFGQQIHGSALTIYVVIEGG